MTFPGKMTSFKYRKANKKMSSLVELSPFVDEGGLGKMWKLFGERTEELIKESCYADEKLTER